MAVCCAKQVDCTADINLSVGVSVRRLVTQSTEHLVVGYVQAHYTIPRIRNEYSGIALRNVPPVWAQQKLNVVIQEVNIH